MRLRLWRILMRAFRLNMRRSEVCGMFWINEEGAAQSLDSVERHPLHGSVFSIFFNDTLMGFASFVIVDSN